MFRVEVFVFLFGLCAVATGWGRTWQSTGAYGVLTCNGAPMPNVLLKLYDKDLFTLDDKLAETKTDARGNFRLSGSTQEWTKMNPKLNIYHNCNNNHPCERKFSINIASKYVNDGKVANNFWPAGTIELSGEYPGETHDCIH